MSNDILESVSHYGSREFGDDAVPFFRCVDDGGNVRPLLDLAIFVRERIEAAEADGLEIGDGDVVDLIADNSDAPLQTIREALVVAGYAQRFPNATRPR